jgi:hypothetical protein
LDRRIVDSINVCDGQRLRRALHKSQVFSSARLWRRLKRNRSRDDSEIEVNRVALAVGGNRDATVVSGIGQF